jgi:hypothetical protein
VNGSRVRMMSAEKSKRGRGLDLVVLDEFAFMESQVWDEQVEPSLGDRLGRALFTTTPYGHNWAYDMYLRGLDPAFPDWQSFTWTTLDGGIVSAAEVERARHGRDPRVFRQEYEASFETLFGRVYSNFDRTLHIDPAVTDTGAELLVGMDFNVDPMTAVTAVRAADQCHFLDAIEIPNSNTEEMGTELLERYPNRKLVVCPDPSGKSRKTSAPVGQTDYTILRRMGMEIRAPSKAPLVPDRVNNTQAMLLNAAGDMRIRVHPRAAALIRSWDGLTYKEGTSQPDKGLGLDHCADAADYLLWQEFNVLVDRRIHRVPFKVV